MPRTELKKSGLRHGGNVKIAHSNTASQLVIYAHGGFKDSDGRVKLQNNTKIHYYTVHTGPAVGDPVFDGILDNPQLAKAGNLHRKAQLTRAEATDLLQKDLTLDVKTTMEKTKALNIPVSETRVGSGDETMFNYALYRHENGRDKLAACMTDGAVNDDIDVGINDSNHKCHVSDFIDLAGNSGHTYDVVHLVACRSLRDKDLVLNRS